jgi:hypothetical protein
MKAIEFAIIMPGCLRTAFSPERFILYIFSNVNCWHVTLFYNNYISKNKRKSKTDRQAQKCSVILRIDKNQRR